MNMKLFWRNNLSIWYKTTNVSTYDINLFHMFFDIFKKSENQKTTIFRSRCFEKNLDLQLVT